MRAALHKLMLEKSMPIDTFMEGPSVPLERNVQGHCKQASYKQTVSFLPPS